MKSMSTTTNAPSRSETVRRSSRWFTVIALLVAVGAFITLAAGGINKNLVYYWTPSDLYARGDRAHGRHRPCDEHHKAKCGTPQPAAGRR